MSEAQTQVLVIEDSPEDQLLVRRALEDVPGCVLSAAHTLQAGLAELRTRTFDAAVVDLVLPDSDGMDTIRAMTATAPGLPLIVLTGHGKEALGLRAVAAGAQDFLVKGVVPLEAILPRTLQYAVTRARAERQRRAVEERFRALAEQVPDIIFHIAVTPEPRVVYMNSAVERLLGYSPREFYDDPELFRRVIHAEDQAWLDQFFAGRLPEFYTMRTTARDGSTRWWETHAAAITEHGEQLVVGIARDITWQKAAEETLKQTHEQLQQAQKMESVGRLAGGVAHDFNNLLTAISSFGGFVLEALPPDGPAARDMQEVLAAASRAADLTKQLLAFSRRGPVSPRVVNLNETLANSERMLTRLVGEDIRVSTRYQPDLWNTTIDPAALEQVIVNLAVNARDAMADGGKLTIQTANVQLDETYSDVHGADIPAGDYVLVSVTDNGTGMDAETQRHIFEPFYTTKEMGKGTGLGLSTCYGIVKQAGGFIWCYSEVGKGTTFKTYLPRCLDPVVPERPTEPAAAPQGDETILLVEDDARIRTLAVRALKQMGFRVLAAEDGEEALGLCAAADAPSLDLLITDVVMPGMSGRRLAQRLMRLRPGLKVLYMSGYSYDSIAHHGVLEPGVMLLEKPFTPKELGRKAREVLAMPAATTGSSPTRARVLVVDDDPSVLSAVERRLRDAYELTLANGGRAALDALSRDDFDVIVCDLIMPDIDGRQVYQDVCAKWPAMQHRFVFVVGVNEDIVDSLLTSTTRPPIRKDDEDALAGALTTQIDQIVGAQR